MASEDTLIRNRAFDDLKNAGIYDRPELAQVIVPYLLRILRGYVVNPETELIIELLKNLRVNAQFFVQNSILVEDSKNIIEDIDQAKDVFQELLSNPLSREASQEIIIQIDGGLTSI